MCFRYIASHSLCKSTQKSFNVQNFGLHFAFSWKLRNFAHMNAAEIDIAVLILFFNRPEQLSKVFAEVRKARPSRLFLYQDGPRDERDMPGIMACREVVSHVDWECDVQHFYQERNFGCDPSEFISQKWAFSLADKCLTHSYLLIILGSKSAEDY